MLSKLPALPTELPKSNHNDQEPPESAIDGLPSEAHYVMASSQNQPVNVTQFLSDLGDDPAIKVNTMIFHQHLSIRLIWTFIQDFLPKLKQHILWRITNPESISTNGEHSFSREDYEQIHIAKDQFFEHKTLRINYTTYDLRRVQDSLSATNHADIICLSRDEEADHPFEYARILRLFHVVATHQVPGGSSMPLSFNILFVRRYRIDPTYHAGFKQKRLHRIQFLPQDDSDAFGFIDPDNVIRAAHLIPGFRYGSTNTLLQGISIARAPDEDDDWLYFHINMSVILQQFSRTT